MRSERGRASLKHGSLGQHESVYIEGKSCVSTLDELLRLLNDVMTTDVATLTQRCQPELL